MDDEPLARAGIRHLLNQQNQFEIAAEADNGTDALRLAELHQPDIIFLDIQMPGLDGLNVFKQLANKPAVIFCSAYAEHAVAAFELSAVDYLLKPFDPSDLTAAILKAHKRIQNDKILEQLDVFRNQFKSAEPKRIVLNTADMLHIVDVEDITYCLADGAYTHFFFTNRKEILVSKTLAHFENIIDNNQFIRTHQSYLVNMRHVTQFDKRNGGFLILPNDIEIPVSTRKKEEVLAHFKSNYQ